MRALGLALLLLAGCTLDPKGQLDRAALKVRAAGLAGGAKLTVTATDSAGKAVDRSAPLSGQASLEVVYTAGSLASGPAEVAAVLYDGDGNEVGCAAASATAGPGAVVDLTLSAPTDNLNCGACGHACAAPNAVRHCVQSQCGPLECDPGHLDVDGAIDDGCEYACTPTGSEDDEASCTDGVDDDCDGKTDCADEGCWALARDCAFMACTGRQSFDCPTQTWSQCQANEGQEASVAACTNGADDDCDGKTDCADDGCNSVVRSCTFMACSGVQAWDCASNSWGSCQVNNGAEASPAACADGLDNDCDGLTDCDDPGCQNLSRTCTYQTCSGNQDWDCASNTWSACTVDQALEATVASCKDGIDNDCDGKKDCNDPGCQNIQVPCGSDICVAGVKTWICLTGLYGLCIPQVPLPESSGLLCSDGLDDDCDGKTDCQDSQCTGLKCATGKVCCADGTCAGACP